MYVHMQRNDYPTVCMYNIIIIIRHSQVYNYVPLQLGICAKLGLHNANLSLWGKPRSEQQLEQSLDFKL